MKNETACHLSCLRSKKKDGNSTMSLSGIKKDSCQRAKPRSNILISGLSKSCLTEDKLSLEKYISGVQGAVSTKKIYIQLNFSASGTKKSKNFYLARSIIMVVTQFTLWWFKISAYYQNYLAKYSYTWMPRNSGHQKALTGSAPTIFSCPV